MATTYTFPTNAEIKKVLQEVLPRLTKDRPIFDMFPITTEEASVLMWEQEDNYRGLQQLRGYNGESQPVGSTARHRYVVQPGVYGEKDVIDELMLTEMRPTGQIGNGAVLDLTAAVLGKTNKLQLRFLDRVESILWSTLGGSYSVLGSGGQVVASDSYTVQTFTAGTGWGTPSTSTPYGDFRTVKLKEWGHGVSFGREATAWANGKTIKNMLENSNASDLFGRRRIGSFGPVDSPDDYNAIAMDADLPMIKEYSEGYLTDANVFTTFIPDNTVYVVGKKPGGVMIGDYAMTRNAQNPDEAPGQYVAVVDSLLHGGYPRTVTIHNGHNGGPRIYYPSAIVAMTVG